MVKITSEVFQVGGEGFSSQEDAAVYLINIGGHAALIDAGCGNSVNAIMTNVRKLDVDPKSIELLLLTHCHFDHTGGARALRDLTGCRIVAHERDAVFLEEGNDGVTAASWYGRTLEPFTVDVRLTGDRQEMLLGARMIQAVHTPGHSPGSMVYLVESDGLNVLFAQDVHGPLDASLLSNKEDYMRSLHHILSLDADILCEGHYGVFQGKEEVSSFIRRFIG
jgi:glyoxylase-like metal-dependent hydrolase (beta-lactamase superfamily II)